MPDVDQANLVTPLTEGFKDTVDAVTRKSKNRVYTPFDETLDEHVRCGIRHARSVSMSTC
jgi:hypothetical protein